MAAFQTGKHNAVVPRIDVKTLPETAESIFCVIETLNSSPFLFDLISEAVDELALPS